MGNLAMFLVLGLTLSFGIANYTLTRLSVEGTENVATYYGSQAARNLSRSALNHYLYKIKKNPTLTGTFGDTNGYYEGGSVIITVTDLGGDDRQVDVSSDFYGNTHTASAKITVTVGGSCLWPYAAFSDDEVYLPNGDGTITGDVYGRNGNVFGGGYTVTGATSQAAPVRVIPMINWKFFEDKAIAVGQKVTGIKTFTTAGSPYTGVWYVTSDAEFEANVQFNGTLVTEGNFRMLGSSVTISATPANYPAVLVKGNFNQDLDNLTVNGFTYIVGNANITSSNYTINGALVTGSKIKGNGTNKSYTYDASYLSDLRGIVFPSCGIKNLLFMVGNPASLSTSDINKKAMLESFGYTVIPIDDATSTTNLKVGVDTCMVVYISESSSSGTIGDHTRGLKSGVIVEEGDLNDEQGLSADAYWRNDRYLNIIDNSHYITSPFSTGNLTLTNSDQTVNELQSTLAPGLQVLAKWDTENTLGVIETGDTLFGATSIIAAGRRVQAAWGGGASGTWGPAFDVMTLTTDGLTIIERTLRWAAEDPDADSSGLGGSGRNSVSVTSLYE